MHIHIYVFLIVGVLLKHKYSEVAYICIYIVKWQKKLRHPFLTLNYIACQIRYVRSKFRFQNKKGYWEKKNPMNTSHMNQ